VTRILIVGGVFTLTLLSACTSKQERQVANGDFGYLQEQDVRALKIPAGVDQPNFNDTYLLPELGKNAPTDMVGDAITVQSPALVLPLVVGSHIEDGIQEATVWFDKVDDSQALDTTIWNSLLSFLEEQGIGVESFDKEQQRLITDWMVIEPETDSSWYSWTKTDRSIGRRFEFNLDLKPHGRSAALKVELKDYLEKVDGKEFSKLNQDQTHRNEVDILNQVIGHYQYQLRVDQAKMIREIRQGLSMEMGFDSNGEAAYMVDARYDVAWPRLLLVLRKLGFNVKDLDKSNGLLFVKYNGSESGWWSNLWSKDSDALDLDNAEYRLHVDELGSKTSVTFLDKENKPFTAKKIADLFEVFSRNMAADDLDI
jgi:outer membrane protein assembly factor BamC